MLDADPNAIRAVALPRNLMNHIDANVVGIKCDEDGLVPADLDSTIQRLKEEGRRIKFLYTIPTFQNPLGSTLPPGNSHFPGQVWWF